MKNFSILLIFICVAFSTPLFGAMAGNESCNAFSTTDPSCNTGSSNSTTPRLTLSVTPTIGGLIAEGGSTLLQSISDFNRFTSLYERSEIDGVDFKLMQAALSDAIANMEKAKAAYRSLKDLAAVTPYNWTIIDRLMGFDYYAFGRERGLIGSIFQKVEQYLTIGDVRGVFREFYIESGRLLELLYSLKRDADAFILPGLSTVWRLNQKVSEFKLFGQYVAEVFYAII